MKRQGLRIARASACAAALALFISGPARAGVSNSADFTNFTQAVTDAGGRADALDYKLVSALGQVAQSTAASAAFRGDAGFLPGYFFPGQIDLDLAGCVTGQLVLEWKAPGNDGYAAGTQAGAYRLIYSTSADLSSPLASPALPAPAQAGQKQSVTLTGLQPQTTYYFSLIAREVGGTEGVKAPAAADIPNGTGLQFDAFAGYTGFRQSLVEWQAQSIPAGGAACTISSYRVYRSTSLSGPFLAIVDTAETKASDTSVLAGSTYYYRVVILNPYDQEIGASGTDAIWVRTAKPMEPVRPRISVAGSSVTMTWQRPNEFLFGLKYDDPDHAREDELWSFRLQRSTDLFGGWSDVALVSSGTAAAVDPAGGAQYYYRVGAENITERSLASLILDTAGNGYVVAPGLRSHVFIPKDGVEELAPDASTAYRIAAATEAFTNELGTILSAVRFDVLHGTKTLSEPFRFESGARTRLEFTPQAGASVNARPVEIDETSIYWHNGAKWSKIYGRPYAADGWVESDVEYLGRFQLRALTRGKDFFFNPATLSNRFITPNGDGLNDKVVFTFDNPRDSRVTGRIFDVRGRLVTTFERTNQFTAEWDGKANGTPVEPGIYLYRLEGDSIVATGTLVVMQ